jgi:DNA-binding response OmpR family regulator
LIVEDDLGVLRLMVGVLGAAGYEVLGARNAGQAEALAACCGQIDLLITDLVLPDHSGVVLAERLLATRPALPVLLCSGYDDERLTCCGVRGGVLRKPFVPSTLLERVRELTTSSAWAVGPREGLAVAGSLQATR